MHPAVVGFFFLYYSFSLFFCSFFFFPLCYILSFIVDSLVCGRVEGIGLGRLSTHGGQFKEFLPCYGHVNSWSLHCSSRYYMKIVYIQDLVHRPCHHHSQAFARPFIGDGRIPHPPPGYITGKQGTPYTRSCGIHPSNSMPTRGGPGGGPLGVSSRGDRGACSYTN